MMIKKTKFTIKEKEATLYKGVEKGPLIVLNTYTGDGNSVYEKLTETGDAECNLLVVGNLNWNHDMTPWEEQGIMKGEPPFTGGAAGYLDILTGEIIPEATRHLDNEPAYMGIAGYSLAGLFALYAICHTDVFDCAASMSGSLWFPGIKEYLISNEIKKRPDKLYLSLGDAEGKTKNPVLKTVQINTEELVNHYRESGLDVIYELNPGNHFKDPAWRSAKGIKALTGLNL